MTHPMRPTAERLNEWLAAALEAHPNGRVALIAEDDAAINDAEAE